MSSMRGETRCTEAAPAARKVNENVKVFVPAHVTVPSACHVTKTCKLSTGIQHYEGASERKSENKAGSRLVLQPNADNCRQLTSVYPHASTLKGNSHKAKTCTSACCPKFWSSGGRAGIANKSSASEQNLPAQDLSIILLTPITST